MKKQASLLPFRTWLYGVFALYLLGMAFYWDSGLAYPATQKKEKNTCCQIKKTPKPKQKCCSGDSCPAPKQEKSKGNSCPSSCPCPCNVPNIPYPSHVILSNENIVAYQSQKQENTKISGKLSQKELYKNSFFSSVALPTDVLPIATGKERLKRFALWRV